MRGFTSLAHYAKNSKIQEPYNLKQFISIFEDLSLDPCMQAFMTITTQDNRELSRSGLLLIPRDYFRELAMIASENHPNELIGIQLLHSKSVNDMGMILTLLQYDHEVREQGGSWPVGYTPGKPYYRAYVAKRRRTPKELMELGYSKTMVDFAMGYIEPDPEWTKIAPYVFTCTKKILNPENIYFWEGTVLELFLSSESEKKLTNVISQGDTVKPQISTERTKLYENLKKAVDSGQKIEIKSFDERISSIMRDLGYDYAPDDGIVRHFAYILAENKTVSKNPLKKLEKNISE